MALTNVLVQQSIANEGQPKALLVDARGQPLITDSSKDVSKPIDEETARETAVNIQKMVDLLEVIAKGISGRSSEDLQEAPASKMNFGNMLGFYGSMLFVKLFDSIFSGIASAGRFIFARVLPFLAKGFIKIIIGFFGFLAGVPGGVAAAIVGAITVAIAGFVRAFKDAFAVYKSGGTFFDIVGTFVEGFYKGALNFVFGVVDWILNLFGLDLPDNLGDIIVDGIKDLFKNIVNYISDLPKRIGGMISGFLNNIGIPEFSIFGYKIGPFYPFRKGEISTPEKDTVGAENKTPVKINQANTTVMSEGKKAGILSDLSGATAPVPKVEVTPINSVIPKPIGNAPAPSLNKKMTPEEAKKIVTEDVGAKFVDRLSTLSMEPRTTGKEITDSDIDKALLEVGTKEQVQAFKTLESGEEGAYGYVKRFNTNYNTLSGNMVKSPNVKPSGSFITPGAPSDTGNQVMTSSAEAESAKSASSSSNIIVNAPSSTVNSPKESNLISSRNVRNDENTLSKYVGTLYGANI
jgi:hypothetical protein